MNSLLFVNGYLDRLPVITTAICFDIFHFVGAVCLFLRKLTLASELSLPTR